MLLENFSELVTEGEAVFVDQAGKGGNRMNISVHHRIHGSSGEKGKKRWSGKWGYQEDPVTDNE